MSKEAVDEKRPSALGLDQGYQRNRRFISKFHNAYMAWAILALSLVITLCAYYISSRSVESLAIQRFEIRADEIEHAIKERLRIYEQTLWSGVALMDSVGVVSREGWARFVSTINIKEHWPGIQGIGFSVPVLPDELHKHVEGIRAEGFADYDIKPAGVRELYSAIIYLEPFDWRNQRAFGYDMYSNGVRREAMERARDYGKAATSGIITLVQETEKDVQRGFLMYVPVYRQGAPTASIEQKRQAFVGWVYAPFRAGDLMNGIVGSEDPNIEFEIYDGANPGPDSLLYDSNDLANFTGSGEASPFSRTDKIILQGREWTIYFSGSGELLASNEKHQPTLIFIAGVVIDILLFMILLSFHFMNRRAETLAEQMTQEYRLAKEREVVANKHKSIFLASMSHELRTPLNSILGFTRLVLKRKGDQLDKREKEGLETVLRNAMHLLKLINGILDLSKIETGRLDMVVEEVDVKALFEDILNDYEQLAADKGLLFNVDYDDNIPAILRFDADKTLQVTTNIISNAVKYTNEGSVAVKFVFLKHPVVGDALMIEVSDTGIGLSELEKESVFLEYQRGEVDKVNKIQGTGLGLAITKKLVELLDGQLRLESENGRGTSITILIPVSVVAQHPTSFVSDNARAS